MKKSINFSMLPVRIAVSDVKYKSIHYHPAVLELLFVLEGRLAITAGQCSTFVQEGEFIAINADLLHTIRCEKISTVVSLYLDLNHYAEQYPHIHGVRFECCRSNIREEQLPYWKELRNFFIRLMLMHNKNTGPAQTIMKDLSDKIVQLLWEHFQLRQDLPPQALERYYSISSYLQENYLNDISVTQVAQNERISVTRLAHFWKDATGRSIRQSLTALRLADAEKMLLETPLTVNEIAYRCAFSDEKYFYQHFKSRYKLTPNEFRIRSLEDQQQTVRVLLSRRESEQQVAAYAMKYYDADIPASMASLSQEENGKEEILRSLYEAILCNTNVIVAQFETTQQDIGYMQIAPDKALFLRENKYVINWEYVYAMMHIFLDFGLSANLLIEFDCMSVEEWRPLLNELVAELLSIWGKRVVESQHYLIFSKVIPVYKQCIALAEYLKQNTPVRNAQAIFML